MSSFMQKMEHLVQGEGETLDNEDDSEIFTAFGAIKRDQ
jgi:hypothetical protein